MRIVQSSMVDNINHKIQTMMRQVANALLRLLG